ncbi:MAG TPA: GNAT family N-acetyltransferase [Candidatus Limiplasma sp.]|nr:GNAT family N-acetyltransferase [Candidatus Limiplasma sp.]
MDYSQGITIRPMMADDYDPAVQLWMATPGMGLNSIDDSREGIARYLRRNPTTSFVAMDGDTLAGVILCGHDGRRGIIHHTAVRPDLRGRGIGKALAQAAIEALRREGIAKVWLVVFKRNISGNAFWEHLGFDAREDLHFRGMTLDHNLVRIDT